MNRRQSPRYPVNQPVRYQAERENGAPITGVGHCVDCSGKGIRFEADQRMPIGTPIELLVHWPVALNETIPLQVKMTGVVVRSAGNLIAVQIKTHESQTADRPVAPQQ